MNDNRSKNSDISAWRKAEAKFKSWVYVLMDELSKSQIFTVNLYKLLLLIETLQFLWFIFNPKYDFLWDTRIFTWVQTALRYFQFDGILSNSNDGTLFVTFLYIAFIFTIIMMIITILTTVVFVNRKDRIHAVNSSTLNYALKTLSGYNLLLTTILAFPFYHIFMATFICRNDDDKHGDIECYKGIYFVHLVVAIVGMVFLLVTTYIFGLLSMDLNPWSKVPYAAPGSKMNVIKLSFKILIILYINLDYKSNLKKEFIIIFALFWLLILVLRYFQTPCYNKSVFNFMLANEMTTFWASVVIFFHAFIDNSPPDNMGFLFMLIGIPPLVYGYIIIVDARASHFRKLHIKNFKRDTDFEMYLLNIVQLIGGRGILKNNVYQPTNFFKKMILIKE